MSQKKKSMLLFLVVALLLVLSLVAVFFLNSHNEQGEIARIYQDGKLIREVSLTDVASPYEFQVEASDGGYNLIRVEKGAIGIKDADCPDKICQQIGMVSDTGYPVTCLPHKLVIQIEPSLPPPMISMRSCSKNPTLLPLLQHLLIHDIFRCLLIACKLICEIAASTCHGT